MEEDIDTTSQAVEALLFLSSDPGAGAGPGSAPNGSKRADRPGAKVTPARQSDNGLERRAAKKERSSKAAARPIKRERSGEPKQELHPPAPLYNQPRDPTQSTSTASEGNPLVSPVSTSARILQQMAGGRTPQQTPNPAPKQSVKVQGIQHEVSASLLERAATEPQLLSFRRTGKSLNLCMLYDGTPYAGYFALNAKANEELNADSSSRSSDGSQAAMDGVDEDANAQAEEEEGAGRGRRRRAAHNYAQLADGSAATSIAASRPSLDLEGKEKLSKQKEIDSQQEWERMENEGPASGAVCALCHGPEDICRSMEIGARQHLPPRHLGKLILARPSLKRMPCWVHEQCALWSADLYHSDAQNRPLLASLGAALRRGLGLACTACHRKGATVSCVYPLCKKVFHVGCAVKSHCHMDASARWCTACPEHYAHAHHTLHTRISQESLMGRPRKLMRRAISTVANPQRNQAHSDQQRSIMSDPGYALPPLFLNPGNPYAMQPFSAGLEGLNAANQGMLMGNIGNMGSVMQSLRMRMPPQMMPGMDALSSRMHQDAQLAAFNRGQGMPPGMQMPFDPMDVQSSSWLPGAGAMFQDSMHSGSAVEDDDDGLASGNRCSVCRVQRKGRCGTLSAPKSCLKRKKMEQAGLSVPPGPPKTSRVRQDLEH